MGKKKDIVFRGNTYFKEAWNMRGMAKWAKSHLPGDVDTLIGTGMSGCLVVPRLAERLGLAWGVVRKPGVSSHAGDTRFEGQMGRNWVMVDDFVCSGDTVLSVVKVVEAEFNGSSPWGGKRQITWLGVLSYTYWNDPIRVECIPFRTPRRVLDRAAYGDTARELSRIIYSKDPGAFPPQAERPGAVPSTPAPALGQTPVLGSVPCSLFPAL